MTNNTNNAFNSHDGIPAYELTEEQCEDRLAWALSIIDDENETVEMKYVAKRAIKYVKDQMYFLAVGETIDETLNR
tara:strand:+ start:1365 stop:1592 length:228 start_codon:yes stop_codon:yes gene_type:complete